MFNQAAVDAAAAAAANPPDPAAAPVVAPAVAQGQNVQGNPAPAAVFTLNPSQVVGVNAFIDYNHPSASELRKTYYKSIEPLAKLYDGSLKGLQYFIFQVETRAKTFGWGQDIFNIPVGNNITHSLFRNHGQITIEHVRAHAATYVGQPTKNCQDADAFKLFLDNSLTETLAMRVLAQRNRYTINGEQHGPTMYRVILSIVGTETAASLAVLNTAIRALPNKGSEFHYDVTLFNEYVTGLINDLFARGKEPQDLEYILYEAYSKFDDKKFVEYIELKKSMVNDLSIEPLEYTDLMRLADERFKYMINAGEWTGQAATAKPKASDTKDKDEHIIALAAVAVLEALQIDTKKVTKGSSNSSGKDGKNTGEWKWKDIAPKPGESQFKSFKGKTYVHCPNHKTTKWVLAEKHKDGCTLDDKWKFPTKAATKPPAETQEMQYQQALMGITADENNYDMLDGEEYEENI